MPGVICSSPCAAGALAEIHFELFRESIRLPRQERERALADLAAEYALRLEHYCRRAPLQWFNFYRFLALADDWTQQMHPR